MFKALVRGGILLLVFALAGQAAAQDESGTRTDTKSGVSVTLPSTWEFGSTGFVRDLIFNLLRKGSWAMETGYTIKGEIYYYYLETPETARAYAENQLASWKATNPDYQYSEVFETNLGDYPSTYPAFAFTDRNSTRQAIYIFSVKGNKGLRVHLFAPIDKWNSVNDEFWSIRKSVRF